MTRRTWRKKKKGCTNDNFPPSHTFTRPHNRRTYDLALEMLEPLQEEYTITLEHSRSGCGPHSSVEPSQSRYIVISGRDGDCKLRISDHPNCRCGNDEELYDGCDENEAKRLIAAIIAKAEALTPEEEYERETRTKQTAEAHAHRAARV